MKEGCFMNCKFCGSKLHKGAVYCAICGKPINTEDDDFKLTTNTVIDKSRGLSITSFVFGLVGVIIWLNFLLALTIPELRTSASSWLEVIPFFEVSIGIPGLVMAIEGKRKGARVLAEIGMVLNLIMVVPAILCIIFFVLGSFFLMTSIFLLFKKLLRL
jgi:hypothetical protein